MKKNANLKLPKTDVHYNDVCMYIEDIPHEDYSHASENARESFRDMKFGVRIHWGLYSKWRLQEESWPFLKMSYEDKEKYQELYKEFNPKHFDADEWMRLFKKAGLKCFAFTSKHHDGFSLFDTKANVKRCVNWTAQGGPQIEGCDFAFSVMDSPFKRDIVKELCDAARKNDIKIDLYFSHPDWFDADFRPYTFHPLSVPEYKELLTEREMEEYDSRYEKMLPLPVAHSLTKEERSSMVARHRQQLTELLTNYGKIDMLCLDMWLGSDVWPELRDTIKKLRDIDPDIMLRCRGIGNYGDYYTPEGFVPGNKENTDMPWMVIYPLAKTFSYDPDASQYKGSEWIIKNLVDSVAKGGNFMVGIGPDENGLFHPAATSQLEEVGAWLDVNGEAIYATRARQGTLHKEGESIYFTNTKNLTHTYAITTQWPGNTLCINTVRPRTGTDIFLLGHYEALDWTYEDDKLIIKIPEHMQNEENRPCKTAYAFKIVTV